MRPVTLDLSRLRPAAATSCHRRGAAATPSFRPFARLPWPPQTFFYVFADKAPDHLRRSHVFLRAQLLEDRLFIRIHEDGQTRCTLLLRHDEAPTVFTYNVRKM